MLSAANLSKIILSLLEQGHFRWRQHYLLNNISILKQGGKLGQKMFVLTMLPPMKCEKKNSHCFKKPNVKSFEIQF